VSARHIESAHEHIRLAELWSTKAEELASRGVGSAQHDVAVDMAIMHARLAQAIMRVHYPS
jgi:hypothetical protein